MAIAVRALPSQREPSPFLRSLTATAVPAVSMLALIGARADQTSAILGTLAATCCVGAALRNRFNDIATVAMPAIAAAAMSAATDLVLLTWATNDAVAGVIASVMVAIGIGYGVLGTSAASVASDLNDRDPIKALGGTMLGMTINAAVPLTRLVL